MTHFLRSLLLMSALPFLSYAEDAHCPGYLNIEAAREYSRLHEHRALLISYCNTLIAEDYLSGFSRETPLRIASIVKNFWGLLALAAQDDGLLNIDDDAARFILEWRKMADKQDITIRELLSMTSGLDPGFKALYWRKPYNAPLTALQIPSRASPGSAFAYGPSGMEAFGEILKRALHSKRIKPMDYLLERILRPLEINYGEWKTDKSGNPMMSGGVKMPAPDLMRLGLFVLHQGSWKGTQVISKQVFRRALAGTAVNPLYGMTFWFNSTARHPGSYEVDIEDAISREVPFQDWKSACIAKSAPTDLIAMIGSGNQRVYVIPSLDLVIARLSDGNTFNDGNFFRELLGRR